MKKNTILLTGASGFIGSWVTKKLLDSNYNVIATKSPFSEAWRLKRLDKKINIKSIDLSNLNLVEKLIKNVKPDVIIHLATHGVYPHQQSVDDRIVIDNYLMTANLLSCAVKYDVEKFVNTGSVFEYGSQKKRVSEDEVFLNDILNKYSAVKMATTALTNSYSSKVRVATLRPFTTYGPWEDESRFVTSTIRRAIDGEQLRIVKNVIRDFIYVEDVAEAFVKVVETNYQSGEILNIASGQKYRLEDVCKTIKKITKSNSKIIYDSKYIRKKESACWANISKAKRLLKWSPKTSINIGIHKTIDSIKKV